MMYICFLQQVGDGYNIAEMFDPWVEQMGFPVIDVTEDGGDLILRQSRFLNDPNIDPESPPSSHGSVGWDMCLHVFVNLVFGLHCTMLSSCTTRIPAFVVPSTAHECCSLKRFQIQVVRASDVYDADCSGNAGLAE